MERPEFGDLLDPSLRKIYDDTEKSLTKIIKYTEIFNVETSKKQNETDSGLQWFGEPEVTPEGGAVNYEDPVQGYDVTYTHETFTKGFTVTRQMYDDDQHRKIKAGPTSLSRRFAIRPDKDAGNVLNNAYSGSYVGGDGVSLCNASHPIPASAGGGTWSNFSATTFDANGAGLATAIQNMRATEDFKGNALLLQPDTLVVPVELADTAYKVLKAVQIPGSADNDPNPRSHMDAPLGTINRLIVWDQLTDANSWFLLDSHMHALNFFFRTKPDLKGPFWDEDHNKFKWTNYMRYSVGFSHSYGVYGCNPS